MGLLWHKPGQRWRLVLGFAVACTASHSARAQEAAASACRVEAVDFEGWKAQQLSNSWVQLVIVPQLGGRVMQVYFDGHPYLFVNVQYKGQYFPPLGPEAKHRWFNYGGDKIWPMPEGDEDEHHWPGPVSDLLDDGNYAFQVMAGTSGCTIRLEGPPDPRTGLQYAREISLESESPFIHFHAMMKNIADHPIQWSVQSVTQYDTSDPQHRGNYNRDFWAFAPANPGSAYLDQYHVRAGLADDPSFRIRNRLFTLHWLPLENEVWLDSTAGWLAVVDAASQYGMIEHFQYFPKGEYPGKATVIFYKNGGTIKLDDQGFPALNFSHPDEVLRYMEAELNSPMVTLAPGQSYVMDTGWNPVRMQRELTAVTSAGVCSQPLQANHTPQGVKLGGSFGVFFSGRLIAQLLDVRGVKLTSVPLQAVTVNKFLELDQTITAPETAVEVSIHLIDAHGRDRGALGTAKITSGDTKP